MDSSFALVRLEACQFHDGAVSVADLVEVAVCELVVRVREILVPDWLRQLHLRASRPSDEVRACEVIHLYMSVMFFEDWMVLRDLEPLVQR